MKRFSRIALALTLVSAAFSSYAVTNTSTTAQTTTNNIAPKPTMIAQPTPNNQLALNDTKNAANTINLAMNTTNNAMSNDERTKVEGVVHDYLLKNPEVLVEALQTLQKKQFEQAEQTVKQTQQIAPQFANALFHQANDATSGNPNGTVTIVEFFDYQCPHCVDMAPVMDAIIKANPNVRVILKDFPIRGPASEFAARATLAAIKQGKYNELHEALLTYNRPLTNDIILDIAKSKGLDVEKLKKDMADKTIDDTLKANMKLAQDLKLFGTPAFFIGKSDAKATDNIKYIPGQMDQNQLQGMIDKSSH